MEGFGLVTGLIDPSAPFLPKFSDVLFGHQGRRFDSLAVLPSNVQALESALLFAAMRAPFVAIVGPSGWGKTHILEAVAYRLSQELREPIEVTNAHDWASSSFKADLNLPLVVDNAQDLLENRVGRFQSRMRLERRVKSGRPTILSFAGNRPNRPIRSFLPYQKNWIVCGIHAPDPSEREQVVRQMCKTSGLFLSDSLIWLIAHHILGDGRTLSGALNNLRIERGHWTEPHMTIQACGVLNPFFADNGTWDLRDHVAECAERFVPGQPQLCRDLALYTLLRVAVLSEEDVAHYFEVPGGQAYSSALRFEATVAQDNENGGKQDVARFMRYVVDSLRAH